MVCRDLEFRPRRRPLRIPAGRAASIYTPSSARPAAPDFQAHHRPLSIIRQHGPGDPRPRPLARPHYRTCTNLVRRRPAAGTPCRVAFYKPRQSSITRRLPPKLDDGDAPHRRTWCPLQAQPPSGSTGPIVITYMMFVCFGTPSAAKAILIGPENRASRLLVIPRLFAHRRVPSITLRT